MAEIDPENIEYDANDECDLGQLTYKGATFHTTITRWDGEPSSDAIKQFLVIHSDADALIADIFTEIRDSYHDDEFMPFYEYGMFTEVHDESGEATGPVYEIIEPYAQAFPNAKKPSDISAEMTVNALRPWSLTLGARDDEPHIQMKFGFGDAAGDQYVFVELDMDKNITDLVIES